MDRRQDLEIILRSRTPLIVMETRDERRTRSERRRDIHDDAMRPAWVDTCVTAVRAG